MLNKAHKAAESRIQDTDVEWRILGALLEPKNVDWVNRISPVVFTENREEVFRAIQLTFIDYGVITFEGVNKHLKGNIPGELFASQGAEIRSAVDEGIRLARKRQLLERSLLLRELSQDFSPDENRIRNALDMPPVMAEEDSTIQTGAAIFMGNMHAKITGDYRFADTGLAFLNNSLGGEWPTQALIGILGRPGSGKTVLVGNSMLRMADNINKKTGELDPITSLFISLEMSKPDLIMRWLGDILSIDTKLIRAGNLTNQQLKNVEEATTALQRKSMYVIDNPTISLASIVYEIRKHVVKYNARVVFVDYLQIINHHPTGNRNLDLGEVALVLKEIAKRENITIVLLSQITEGNDNTFRFRDSGVVGSIVDAAVELYLDSDDIGPVKNMMLQWHKNRYGPLSKTAIQFIPMYQRFEAAVVD